MERKGLINYKGQELSIPKIAQKESISASTLRKYYKETQDIEQAVEKCKKLKIEYNGESLTLNEIAKRNGMHRTVLKKYYEQTNDIGQAIDMYNAQKKDMEGKQKIYKGQKRSVRSISLEENMDIKTINKYLRETGDMDSAIKLYREKQKQRDAYKIEYKGELKSLRAIAQEENIPHSTLRRYYQKYQDINKAVFMVKVKTNNNKKIQMGKGNISLYDLSIILGRKYSDIINDVNNGLTLKEINKKKPTARRRKKLQREQIKVNNGQTLLEYCMEYGYNYSFIYRAINNYGKTLEEAVEDYNQNGSNMPSTWIYEKYDILLSHLMTAYGVNTQRVVQYMRKELISMEEAIEKYIIVKNAKIQGVDAEWVLEIYGILTADNVNSDYGEFKKLFYISEDEEECVIKSYDENIDLQRKLLLFEIAEAIKSNSFSDAEMQEVLHIYDVKPKEIDTMFLELYSKFDNKLMIASKQEEKERRKQISEIIQKWYYLGDEQRKKVLSDNNILPYEEAMIIDVSSKIIKYKNMIQYQNNAQLRGR